MPVANCVQGRRFQTTPPTVTSNRVCSKLTSCTLGSTYQTTIPTATSNRICAIVSACRYGTEYLKVAPTVTTNSVCASVTLCDGATPYQAIALSTTMDRTCTSSCWAGCVLGVTWARHFATSTSNAVCNDVTQCSVAQVDYANPTVTSDRVCIVKCNNTEYVAHPGTQDASCQPIGAVCATGCHQSQNPVPGSTDRVCDCERAADASGLSTREVVGIVLGSIVLCVLAAIGFVAIGRCQSSGDRRRVEEAEMQLFSARQDSAASEATVRRIMSAWEIPADHLTFLQDLAEGSSGSVWKGLWGSQPVAIKVLKQTPDDEHGASKDFRRECEALQAIKHPNLIVFLGAGTTAEGKPFLVSFLSCLRAACNP
jgi:hypothetical protein